MGTEPRRSPKPTFESKLSTILSIAVTVCTIIYFYLGGSFIPQALVLIAAGQVLSRGINSLLALVLDALARVAKTRPVPIDIISATLVDVDTRFGGVLNPWSLIFGGFVSLILQQTPEVLLGTFASDQVDVRVLQVQETQLLIGSLGGAYSKDCYWTSGLLLLANRDPTTAYAEVAYKFNDLTEQGRPESYSWAIPRKPAHWYRVFAEKHQRKPDEEARIYVPNNPVVVLQRVERPGIDVRRCVTLKEESFGYRLIAYVCPDEIFGFRFDGPRIDMEIGFFRIRKGKASVRYKSNQGNRVVSGGPVHKEEQEPVSLPRYESLWDDMKSGFLNAVSFNNDIKSTISLVDRLALSSIIRTTSFGNPTGFEDKPLKVKAFVSEVRLCNVPRIVIFIMFISVLIMAANALYFRLRLRILSGELEQLIVAGNPLLSKLSSVPRYARKERGLFDSIWVKVESNPESTENFASLVVPTETGNSIG